MADCTGQRLHLNSFPWNKWHQHSMICLGLITLPNADLKKKKNEAILFFFLSFLSFFLLHELVQTSGLRMSSSSAQPQLLGEISPKSHKLNDSNVT